MIMIIMLVVIAIIITMMTARIFSAVDEINRLSFSVQQQSLHGSCPVPDESWIVPYILSVFCILGEIIAL